MGRSDRPGSARRTSLGQWQDSPSADAGHELKFACRSTPSPLEPYSANVLSSSAPTDTPVSCSATLTPREPPRALASPRRPPPPSPHGARLPHTVEPLTPRTPFGKVQEAANEPVAPPSIESERKAAAVVVSTSGHGRFGMAAQTGGTPSTSTSK